MSIQQSINQGISGSLYLLSQSNLYKTLKEEREEKIAKEKNRIESLQNIAHVPKLSENEPLPMTPTDQKPQDAGDLFSGELFSPDGGHMSDQEASTLKDMMTKLRWPEKGYPYSQQVADFDLQQHLQRKVAEASRTEQLSREYRGQLTGRGDTLG